MGPDVYLQLVALIAVPLIKENVAGQVDPDEIARKAFDLVDAIGREFQRRGGCCDEPSGTVPE